MQGKKCNLHLLIFKCKQPTMVPDTSFTLDAFCICQWAHTGVGAETLPAVAHPGFTEITDCTLQPQEEITSGLLQCQQRDLSHHPQCILLSILSMGSLWYWTKPVFRPSCSTVHICLLFISAGLGMMQSNFVIYLNSGFLHLWSHILHMVNCVLQLKPGIHKL